MIFYQKSVDIGHFTFGMTWYYKSLLKLLLLEGS
jgi:hypothetical protein